MKGSLEYPADAEEHFVEVEKAIARWKQKVGIHHSHSYAGYGGPCMYGENERTLCSK